VTKRIKVFLTNNRWEEIELPMPISAENWWVATKHDGGEFVVLNGTRYLKAEILDAHESHIVRTDMDGV
jgi:hypothetical protein